MCLPFEMIMKSLLVIVAFVSVATRSLPAVSQSVDVDRGIATQSLPALLIGTSLRPQLGGLLVRLPQDVAPPRWAASAGGER
jgi:hypothetical protein